MAFGNAFLGIVHAMAHITGATFHLIHGRTNATYLPHVIRYNGTIPTKLTSWPKYEHYVAPERYQEIAQQAVGFLFRQVAGKLAAQQAQIDALTQQNSSKDSAVSQAQSAASAAQSQANEAQSQAQTATAATQAQAEQVNSLKSTVADIQTTNAGLAQTISTTKGELNDAINSPSAIRYKGVTITPVAFFAFENVWRQRSVNSDVNTPFNSIPLPSANQGHVSELNFSGRQSRLGLLVQGDGGPFKLTGYFEGDFLSSGTTSNGNQSNSYTFRQRQFWAQASTHNFTVTGGQMWSLVTETGLSTNNRTEKLPNSVDAQYTVGFSWARQPAIQPIIPIDLFIPCCTCCAKTV